MPEHITVPPTLMGDTETKVQQLRSYLTTVSDILNRNFDSIGDNDLTDREREAMAGVVQTGGSLNDVASLRDLIVRSVEYFKQALQGIEKVPLSAEVLNGHFAQYVKAVEIGVAADPAGTMKTDQLITILQKLKQDDIGIRNYIYAGKLRTVSGTVVYGVAIGKDVVTYTTAGVESFHPENAAIEVLADGIKGKIMNATTAETNMNNVTDSGTYWLTMSDMTNGPSDLSAKHEVTVTGDGTRVNQRIYGSLSIYFRHYDGSSWGSWRKVEGTQV